MTDDEIARVLRQASDQENRRRAPPLEWFVAREVGRDLIAEAWAACRDPREMRGLMIDLVEWEESRIGEYVWRAFCTTCRRVPSERCAACCDRIRAFVSATLPAVLGLWRHP